MFLLSIKKHFGLDMVGEDGDFDTWKVLENAKEYCELGANLSFVIRLKQTNKHSPSSSLAV